MIGQAVLPTPELVFEPLLPELALVLFAIVGLLYEAFAKRSEPIVHLSIGLVGIALAAATSLWLWSWEGPAGAVPNEPVTVLGGAIAFDRFAVLARLLLLVVAALGLLLGHQYFARSGDEQRGEFTPLLLFATSGMTLIVASADLIVTFLALEILSLALYVLTGLTGRRAANEAAMKYFLLGAFSSAFFLYGVAMAYGATGTTKIAAMAIALTGRGGTQALAVLGLALLAVGFAFKISAAPFHMWTPDVYQGAPSPVTAFMSAATKIAAFAALIRVLNVAFQALAWDWAPVVWGLAAALGGGRQHPGDRADERETDARVLEHRARRIHPDRAHGCRVRGHPGRDVLPGGVRRDDDRGVRHRDDRVGPGRGADPDLRLHGLGEDEPVRGGADDALPALAGRDPADRGLHREGDRVHGGDRCRLLDPRPRGCRWRASRRPSSIFG